MQKINTRYLKQYLMQEKLFVSIENKKKHLRKGIDNFIYIYIYRILSKKMVLLVK